MFIYLPWITFVIGETYVTILGCLLQIGLQIILRIIFYKSLYKSNQLFSTHRDRETSNQSHVLWFQSVSGQNSLFKQLLKKTLFRVIYQNYCEQRCRLTSINSYGSLLSRSIFSRVVCTDHSLAPDKNERPSDLLLAPLPMICPWERSSTKNIWWLNSKHEDQSHFSWKFKSLTGENNCWYRWKLIQKYTFWQK